MEDSNLREMNAYFLINKFCNFDCPYCFIPKEKRKNPLLKGNRNIESIIEFFNNSKRKWHIGFTGGEPFLSPRFIELCIGLTQKNIIRINTNLSSDLIYEFAEKIDPKKVESINWSVHLTEIERLKTKNVLIKKFHMLRDRGFNISASLVVWPKYLDKSLFSEKKIIKIYNEFKKNGICLCTYPFIGEYKGKMYPESFAPQELKLILNLLKNTQYKCFKIPSDYIKKNTKIITGHLSFKGMLCSAGTNHVAITENGDVKRCHSNTKILGNIYKKNVKYLKSPSLCESEICGCYWEGIINAIGKPKTIFLKPGDKFQIPA